MNIIFGREQAEKLSENYTVLELDTIKIGSDGLELTAFCVIDAIPIMKMHQLESMKSLHHNLMIEYRKRNWNYCYQAMEHLVGFWDEEMNTFYENLKTRIDSYQTQELPPDWSGIVTTRNS